MNRRWRSVLGITILAIIAVVGWSIPWQYFAGKIGRYITDENDDRPAWTPADGQIFKIALFPELFEVVGNRYGGDGKSTFAVPKIDEYDYLANDRFGTVMLFRCIATRKLRDNSPTGTLGWCDRNSLPHSN